MKNEDIFWNNPNTIKWFSEQSVPGYWIEFFKSKGKSVKTVLDLGCGAGRNTQLLFELGYDTYACDKHDGMVKTTRKCLQQIGLNKTLIEKQVIKASMLNLPYEDNFFDVVLSNGVFHNVSSLNEIELAIKETSRVLKKNGYVCFNMFSSKYIDPSLKDISDHLYLTKEKLPMVLISKSELNVYFKKLRLVPEEEIFEYKREVTTGKRSVMRGVFKKI